MITRVARSEAAIVPLPGRTWHDYVGPQNSPAKRVSIGVSTFPPGSRPVGHVHPAEEETIYCAPSPGPAPSTMWTSSSPTRGLTSGPSRP